MGIPLIKHLNHFSAYIYSVGADARPSGMASMPDASRVFKKPERLPDSLLAVLRQNAKTAPLVKTLWISVSPTGETPTPMLLFYQLVETVPAAAHFDIARALMKGVDQVIDLLQSVDCLHIDKIDQQLQQTVGTSSSVVYQLRDK